MSDENAKIRASPTNRRELPASQDKLQKIQVGLQGAFAIWPSNVEQLMKNQEDLTFLHSMKTDRKATFGALDKMTAAREKRKEARLSAENDRKRMYEERHPHLREPSAAEEVSIVMMMNLCSSLPNSDHTSVSKRPAPQFSFLMTSRNVPSWCH